MTKNLGTTRFENGLTVLTERMPDLRSATLGFWFKRGSRDEPAALNGISHFIEHAVFKGTKKRTALEIAVESDRLGGNIDAFTMHEQTSFMIKVTDRTLPQAFDLLADMLANPLFDETDLLREQKVVIEEIKMVEDSPEELLAEIFQRNFFPGSPLGLPIEGTKDTVPTFDNEAVSRYHSQVFQPQNLVIAAAGNLEHEQIVKLAEKFFVAPASQQISAGLPGEQDTGAAAKVRQVVLENKVGLEQAHFILATPWIEEASEKRYAAHLLESILGHGTSSRLWQKIREERGLAYSVGAGGVSFRDCGFFSVAAATSTDQFAETVELAVAEMRRIKNEAVSDDELSLAKEQSAATILLSLEDSSVRAENLAQQEMTFGRQIPVDETLQKIEQVTADEIQEIAAKYFLAEDLVLTALGSFGKMDFPPERLEL